MVVKKDRGYKTIVLGVHTSKSRGFIQNIYSCSDGREAIIYKDLEGKTLKESGDIELVKEYEKAGAGEE